MRGFISSFVIIAVFAAVIMSLVFISSYYSSKPPVSDTYGNSTDTNTTVVRENVITTSSGITNALGGIMLFCGALTLISIGAYVVFRRPV